MNGEVPILMWQGMKSEVFSFQSVFWLKEFHIDGIRMDAISNMLYYTRENEVYEIKLPLLFTIFKSNGT